jgi:PncC family amidohydrolase
MASTIVHKTPSSETAWDIAVDVIRRLREVGETAAVAESLTAGGVMAAFTAVPGASAVFRGGVVAYATPLKRSLLGVDAALIEKEGVVHGEVAVQMAEGVRKATAVEGEPDGGLTTWGVSTTGVAGPGPQDGKAAGTVYIGVASPWGSRAFGPFLFPGSRENVREATAMEALSRLGQMLMEATLDREKWQVEQQQRMM